jgi:hypothetical protein
VDAWDALRHLVLLTIRARQAGRSSPTTR